MRFNALRGAAVGACLLWAASAADAAQGKGIPWAKSLQVALTQARKTNKLVMADFYTDW